MKYILLFAALLFSFPAVAQQISGGGNINPIPSVSSTAAEGSHVFKASTGYLYGISVTSGATAGYVMIFNAATVPSDGSVTPVACYYLPATDTIAVSYYSYPIPLSTGVVAVFSSTGCFTKTLSATATFTAQIQ